eukprot:maker-scaffold138_size318692-snap-gene-0.4 protein:Tk02740 transcript:maker-scaffold138_size318692-snap-gene-0.4-mRNA-1 annotation:"hypothetical protein RirG_128980"
MDGTEVDMKSVLSWAPALTARSDLTSINNRVLAAGGTNGRNVPPGVQPTLTVNPFHLQKVNGNGACSRDWFQVNGIGNHGEDKDRNSTNNMVRFCDQIVNPIVLENLVPDAHNIVEMQFKVNSNNGEAGFTFNLCLPDDDPPWPRDK